LVGVAAKAWFLEKHGFAGVAGSLSLHSLSLGQRLSFFRADLAFGILLVPLCFVAARAVLPIRWYSRTVGGVTVVALLVQLVAFGEFVVLGNLAGYGLLLEGLDWGIAHPSAALEYLVAYKVVTPLLIVGGAAAALLWVWPLVKHRREALQQQMYAASAALWIACAVPAIAAWLPRMRPTVFHSAMISLAAHSLFGSELESESSAARYDDDSLGALRLAYQKVASVSSPEWPRPYWGAAKGYDVVLFVMETGPARVLSWNANLSDFPSLKRLRQHAWVGTQHYTTSPESFRAVTSMLLSMYPVRHSRSFAERPQIPPGLIRNLHDAGYRTGVYLPNAHGTRYAREEEDYYKTLGPDRVASLVRTASAPGWQEAANLDVAVLRALEADYRASASTGTRFVGVYAPQLSHEPWVDVSPGGDEHDMARRRYNLMKVEDRELGELITTLEHSGRLDRTLIVVTCDHGLRSSESDSSFRTGQIDDLTFHVPFLLYAPGIVKQPTNLPWVTSHIDITPSILDLLGISQGRDFEAGTAIWNEGLRDRSIFFWASQYFGANGYHSGDSFSMWNPMIDVTYRSHTLHFTPAAAVPRDSSAHRDIIDRIQTMGALASAWYNLAIRGPSAPPRNLKVGATE
jgi:glucan phosphoethanolaminetransferase (alkaline phosphatase superfamily)